MPSTSHRAIAAPAPRTRVLPTPPGAPDGTAGTGAFQILLPALGGVGMVLFLLAGRNPLLLVAGVVMLVVTVGGALGMVVSARVGPRRRFALARSEFLDALGTVRGEIRTETRRQRLHDDDCHPDPVTLLARVTADAVRSRPPAESRIARIGVGTVPHPVQVVLPEVDADPVSLRAMTALARAYRTLPASPITVDLAAGDVSVLGPLETARALVRATLLQLAAIADPAELRISIVTTEPSSYAWARWLPHLRSTDGSLRIGSDIPDLPPTTRGTTEGEVDHLLVLDPADHEPVPVPGRRVLGVGGRGDATPTCIEVGPDGVDATLRVHETSVVGLTPDLVGSGLAEPMCRALAGRHARAPEAPGAGTLAPARVLGVDGLDDFDPAVAWTMRDTRGLLTVVVGADAAGNEVCLDLKESGHGGTGPHGLLVGATGSGKSELLRSIVLGLAAGHHPDDLAFVLVDYKGGATFSGLEELPHVAGVVTNLGEDLGLVDRMHTALLGEIRRRQQVLHDAGRLKDVYEYRAARREGRISDGPLPHLLVVVDEFAELLTATPDLLDLFTTVGRIGRSIGVHQLLASQRLDDGRLRGLESFLSYRFALRTFTAEESRAVIGSSEAAELPTTPGAGYLRTVETVRFQAAYVSGPATPARPAARGTVRLLPWTGARRSDVPAEAPLEDGPSLLEAAVARMQHAAARTRPVWLEPLPTRATRDLMAVFDPPAPFVARLGLVDLPAEQRVAPLDLDLRRGDCHLAVLGGPDSGRSTTLRTLAHALAVHHGPDELVVHGIDLDGDSLRPLEDLPQVGSVAGRREEELTRRILQEVLRGLDRRADAGSPASPEIVLLVDGYGTLKAHEDLHDQVVAIATRGADLGVHVVVTAARWHDLRPALQTSIHARVELRLADPMDSVLDRRLAARLPAGVPGRAVVAGGHLAQIVLPGDGVDERTAYRAVAQVHRGRAEPVRLLPSDLRLEDLLGTAAPAGSGTCWLGVGEEDLQPVPLPDDAHLLVLGDRQSGRTSLLASLVRQRLADPRTVIALIDPRRTLIDDVPAERLAGYAANVVDARDLVLSLAAELETRVTALAGHDRAAGGSPDPRTHIVLVVDDAELVTGVLDPLAPLEPYLPLSEDLDLRLLLARHSGGAARALYSPVLQRLKELGCTGLLLSGDPEEGHLWPGAPMRHLPPGRAVLTRRGRPPTVVHLARP